MLSNNNVNQISSTIKIGIDAWYKKNMMSYTNKVEETIFCNNRSIDSLGGWNSIDGDITSKLQFKDYVANDDLGCANETDKFSTANTKAQLTYSVGLLTSPEINISNNKNVRKTSKNYRIASPTDFKGIDALMGSYVTTTGAISSGNVYTSYGVRPAVSLKSGTEYISGTGSKSDPYIVE